MKTNAALLALTLALAGPGGPAPNTWTALNDGTFALPAQGWPNLTGPALCWIADRDTAMVAPILTESELKAVVRLKSLSRMEVAVLRLEPSTLKLTPLE